MDGPPTMRPRRRFWEELILQGIAVGGLLLTMKLAMKYLDPYREQREQAKKRSAFLAKVLGRKLDLNEYEQLLAANVINPAHIETTLDDVCGLDDLVRELELKVLKPVMHPELYCTTLWKPTRGVLLYGPPGTGKTMLAKALARYSGMYFLNITASSIMSKWLGDANRLVRAIFTLAEKLQPCIIFIDEVDAMLGKRGGHSEHEASLQVKTEFMQLWDGMESGRGQRIVVMGATNRPWQVDEAVLRRFAVQHEVGLPSAPQRKAILSAYLARHDRELSGGAVSRALLDNTPLPAGYSAPGSSTSSASASKIPSASSTAGKGAQAGSSAGPMGCLDYLASRTEGFSGSDLMELCSHAAQRVLADHWAAEHSQRLASQARGAAGAGASGGRGGSGSGAAGASSGGDGAITLSLRPVDLQDFEAALRVMRPATEQADDYSKKVAGMVGSGGGAGGAGNAQAAALMQLLQILASQMGAGAGAGGDAGDS